MRDHARCGVDHHGCEGCAHVVTGPAAEGSPDVLIDGRHALRVGDRGHHAACCGENRWIALGGAANVFVNGRKAHRMGDATAHCGGAGTLVTGSTNVYIGDHEDASGIATPHDRTMIIRPRDALGRSLLAVTVSISCPHRTYPVTTYDGDVRIGGLCRHAAVAIVKTLQLGEREPT